MAVDAANSSREQALKLIQRKKQVEEEENGLITDAARAKRARERQASKAREETEEELVKISKEGASKADQLRRSQNNAVELLNQQTQDHYNKLSDDTAARIKALDDHAMKQIADHQASAMKRIQASEDRMSDPFYHMKSLEADVKENDTGYEIKIKVPEYEMEHFFVSADRNILKLSLARASKEELDMPNGRKNQTASHQTIVETVTLPTRVDPTTAHREYKDGYIIYTVGKLV